jgi:hypothetical protein
VVHGERADRADDDEREAERGGGAGPARERVRERAARRVRERGQVQRGRDDDEREGEDRARQEREEGRVVAVPDAVVHPLAVVVAALDAVVALRADQQDVRLVHREAYHLAVAGPGWSIRLASDAVLDPHTAQSTWISAWTCRR